MLTDLRHTQAARSSLIAAGCVLAALIAGGAGPGTLRAQSPYLLPQTLTSPGGPTRVAAGDFNSDGRLDLAVNSPGTGRLTLHMSSGGLFFGSRISIFVGGRPSAVAVADMDRDGVDDLVWADEQTGNIGVLYTRGANPVSFQPVVVAGADEAVALALFDRDGNGWLDVVVAHRGSDAISWYRNLGTTLELWEVVEVGDGPHSLVVVRDTEFDPVLAVVQRGFLASDVRLIDPVHSTHLGRVPLELPGAASAHDLFGDAGDELVLTDAGTGRVRILGRSSGSWSTTAHFDGERGSAVTRELVSVSSENRLLVAESSRNRLRLWRDDNGGGNFDSFGSWFVGSGVEDFLVVDLGGDGAEEIVVPLPEAGAVKIVRTAGEGLLAPRAELTANLPIRVERDGSIDTASRVVVLGLGEREVWVYRLVAGGLELDATINGPPSSKEVALADLDGEGESDLLVLDGATGVWRALAQPAGGFGPLELVAPVVGSEDFAVAQLVGGAALDLAVADPSVPGIRIFEGDGAGGFTAHSTLLTAETVFVIRSEDLDLDGFADLIALGEIDDLSLFYGSANGPNPAVTLRVGPTPRDLAFGHFNNDPFPDMVVTSAGFSTFAVVTSVFAGFYTVANRSLATPYGSQNCEAFDVNGDGFDDVIISSPGFSQFALHLATGDPSLGTFVPVVLSIPATSVPLDLRAVRLDNDAIADLLVLDHFSGTIVLVRSDPLSDLEPARASLSAQWVEGTIELEVIADVRQTNELALSRASDLEPLALEALGSGRWRAADAEFMGDSETYVLRDLRGVELDRVSVSSGTEQRPANELEFAQILPPTQRGNRVEFRFRVAGNSEVQMRVYDLRGRRLAELTPAPAGDGWYTAWWDARDHAGRRAARGRYLVRVRSAGEPLVTSVVLR